MFHSPALNFHSVHNQLHLPFPNNSSVLNELEFEGRRIMRDHDYLLYRRSGFALITQHISHWVVPERVYAFATLNSIMFYIRYILAFRTELL
jgi:hypothetical protein